MRKKYISEEELNEIIRLNELGASWLKIQKETGIPRRSAKRAYDEYMRSKSVDELKAARQQIISEQFDHHLQDLISLAQLLISRIGDPTIRDMKNAEMIMDDILKVDVRVNRIQNPLTGKAGTSPEVVIRQNKMLFTSLRAHTREKVAWKLLEEWQTARNDWINNLSSLKTEAAEIVHNLIRQLPIGDVIMKKVGNNEISEIIDGVVDAVCRAILNDRLDEAENLVKLIPQEKGVQLTFSGDSSGKLLRYEDAVLTNNICNLARQSVTNLRAVKESRIVDNMANAVNIMRKKKLVLEVMLDELRLIPLILGTRCDICPAL